MNADPAEFQVLKEKITGAKALIAVSKRNQEMAESRLVELQVECRMLGHQLVRIGAYSGGFTLYRCTVCGAQTED